jgi:hypothetical protein
MKKLLTLIAVFFTSLLNKEKKPHGGYENAKRGIIKKLLYNLYYVYDNYIIRALATKNVKKGLTDTDCRKSNNNVGTTLGRDRKIVFEKNDKTFILHYVPEWDYCLTPWEYLLR